MDGPPGGDGGAFQRHGHQGRVHLGLDVEAANVEGDDRVGWNAEALAPGLAMLGRKLEVCGVDPERERHPLRFRAPAGAVLAPEIVAHHSQLRVDRGPHGGGRTDQGIMAVHRSHEQIPHDLHNGSGGGGVRDAAGRVADAHHVTQPGFGRQIGRRDVEDAGIGEVAAVALGNPAYGTGGRLDPGDQGVQLFGRARADVPQMEAIDLSVSQEAAQEALARGMPSQQPLPRGVVAVGVEVDRRVRHGLRVLAWHGAEAKKKGRPEGRPFQIEICVSLRQRRYSRTRCRRAYGPPRPPRRPARSYCCLRRGRHPYRPAPHSIAWCPNR